MVTVMQYKPMRVAQAFGLSLRAIRIECGISQDQLERAIGEQRDKVGIGITLGYCLHLWSSCETEQKTYECDEQIEDAIQWADKRQITSMLLVLLHSVHKGLDAVSLQKADVDPKAVLLAKGARKVAKDGGAKQGGNA